MTGVPGLGEVPGLNQIMTSNSKTMEDDEILVIITPHVLTPIGSDDTEIWLSKQ